MKLDKSHIGKKFRVDHWTAGDHITLIGFDGEDVVAKMSWFDDPEYSKFKGRYDFVPYQEPQETVLMSAVIHENGRYITDSMYESAEAVLKAYGSDSKCTWPLKVVLKNVKLLTGDLSIEKSDISAELWIEVPKGE